MKKEPTELMQNLFTDQGTVGKQFRSNIRSYNGALAMASKGISGKMYDFPKSSKGPPLFKMSGQVYHLMGSLIPEMGQKPKFSQLYVHDRQNEVSNRLETQPLKDKLDSNIMENLQKVKTH